MKAAVREFDVPKLATEATLKGLAPQHYAMPFLGLVAETRC